MSGRGARLGDGALELEAPAKVNLYLRVLGRRPDGYHELVTVLQAVDLCDRVRLRLRPRGSGGPSDPAPGAPDVRLVVTAEDGERRDVPEGPANLVVRAAHALLAEAGASGEVGIDIALHKRIPSGGGLGGGSSDAAATLAGLHRLLGSPCGGGVLARLAAELGSDVPFFLHGGTALCTGRGERVEPLPALPPFRLTLLVPPFGTPTPAVYAALGAGPAQPTSSGELSALRRALHGADEERLAALFRNDLQAAAARVQPALGELLARPGHHLSGSGSTLFRFGHDMHAAPRACRAILICSRAAWGKP
jgi:4-diphosphocytidyl-2-C-methyl-D-erythritol kinase